MIIFLYYILIINLATLIAFGIDKRKAKKHNWRISEATLLWMTAFGGSIGAWAGMRLWHHKTLHKKFRYGVPLLFVLHLSIAVLLGSAIYMLQFSLCPSGKEECVASMIERVRKSNPEAPEWIEQMQKKNILRDTFILNNKGLRLHALYADRKDARGTVVLSHGYTDNAIYMLMFAPFYYDSLHYNILAPDHVRHGLSEGDAIQMGWFDRLNLELWIDVADKKWTGTPIILHGVSMGAATVMMCAGDSLPASVKGIVEDSGYTSVWDEFSSELNNKFHLPERPLIDITSLLCQLRYGWNFREASALEQVRHSKLPILFIHGDSDTYVPTAMVHSLYDAKTKGYKQLWIAPSSAHTDSYSNHREEYHRQLRLFINRTL